MRVFTTNIQHSLLNASIHCTCQHSLQHASIHCYHSASPTTLQHSLLPFSIPYYVPVFTTNIQNSLLHASIHCYHSAFPTTASIHCYHSAFPITLQHSLLPFIIPSYMPVFTANIQDSYCTPAFTPTIQISLLHASIHWYHSEFPTAHQHSLLAFSIPYYTPAFTTNIQHSPLHASINC